MRGQGICLAIAAGLVVLACGDRAPVTAGVDTDTRHGGVTLLADTATVEGDTATAGGDTASARGDTASVEETPVTLENIEVLLNPYGRAPLTAIIKVTHPLLVPEEVRSIRVTVEGQGDPPEDLVAELDPRSEAYRTSFDMGDQVFAGELGIPVLGLYPESDNRIGLEVGTPDATFRGEVVITTDVIPELEGETARVQVLDPDRIEPGWTYIDKRVYDHQGRCRWIGPRLYHILENGNILIAIDEYNWLGRRVRDRSLSRQFEFHHDAIGLGNGNYVVCVNDPETTIVNAFGELVTEEDQAVEVDGETREMVNVWDMRGVLDVDRHTVSLNYQGADWFHMNTVTYSAADDALLFSGRYQGIVKMTRDGVHGEAPNAGKSLVWILAPHMGWGPSGPDGEGDIDPNDYLLTAVDSEGRPYPEEVQNNLAPPSADREAFYWPIGQHGIEITDREEGKIAFLTFNNQASFIFDGEDTIDNGVTTAKQGDLSNDRAEEPFSQIIEYEVDEVAMTVRQKWSFGEYRSELYGAYNSDVCVLPVTRNRMMTTNGADWHEDRPPHPHVIEMTLEGEELYHLEIENATFSAMRGGRIDLYHPERLAPRSNR